MVSQTTLTRGKRDAGGADRHVLVIAQGRSVRVDLPVVGRYEIGRSRRADICIDDASVSRRHARLVVGRDHAMVTDHGSHNGTLVNGRRIDGEHRVSSGDVIVLGVATVVLELGSPPADAGGDGDRAQAPAPPVVDIGGHRAVVADPAMARTYALLRRLAAGDISVLITGETGVGKEFAARAVHEWSARAGGPFVAMNCAALPETLVESELFGYKKGAFSGAVGDKPGLLETAAGGTLFLDEIGEVGLALQAKLLRVIESGEFLRVGDVVPRVVDFRLVAATNRDLRDEIAGGGFREDLYYRLAAATVAVPPLRERRGDIAPLARWFLARARPRIAAGPRRIRPERRGRPAGSSVPRQRARAGQRHRLRLRHRDRRLHRGLEPAGGDRRRPRAGRR